MRQKNQNPGDDSNDGSDEDHAGRNVLADFGQLVEFLGMKIDNSLNTRIDHFSDQDDANDKDDDRPLGPADAKIKTGQCGENGKEDVNLKVWLGSKGVDDAVEGVFEGNRMSF